MEFETSLEFGGYMVLEPLSSIDEFNQAIEIGRYAPGFLAFASDGGGEVFAFDASGAVYLLPLIGMSPDHATKVANSWQAYVSQKI